MLHVDEIPAARDERTGDVVHVVLNAEEDVLLVLLAQIDLIQDFIGEAHALSVGKLAADEDFAKRVGFAHFQNAEGEKPVV